MKFRDFDLDFDILDADTADAYLAALQLVIENGKEDPNASLGDNIRRECNAVFDFFDTLLGDGFHKKLFGERTNRRECLTAFVDFCKAAEEQKTTFEVETAEMMAQLSPHESAD